MNNEENKKYEELGRLFAGESSQPEAGNDKELQDIWNAAGSYSYDSTTSVEAGWQDLKNRIGVQAPMKVSWMRRHSYAVAASFAVILMAGAGIWFQWKRNALHPQMVYSTTASVTKKITLSDGSTITLNGNSKVIVGEGFNQNNRSISLTGEAKFEVARNEEIPFQVNAGTSHTEVLGTGFDIQAYPGENISIVVRHGKVSFSAKGQELILTKGKAAVFEVESEKLTAVSGDTNSIQWDSELLVFKKANLRQIGELLNHRFGKTLVYKESEATRTFTGKFEANATAEQIAQTMSEALGLELTVK
ncbi:MAG: FecR domain-containing protein [Bacteroidetes bacterium]|nr:FecR domain-containing protein [Bacteroidota bacterium]